MNIDSLTVGEAKKLMALFGNHAPSAAAVPTHPMIGRKCIIRTEMAGVHFGTVVAAIGNEVHLQDALRFWKFVTGKIGTISDAANTGLQSGSRVAEAGEIFLTGVIEIVPVTARAEKTYATFVEK